MDLYAKLREVIEKRSFSQSRSIAVDQLRHHGKKADTERKHKDF